MNTPNRPAPRSRPPGPGPLRISRRSVLLGGAGTIGLVAIGGLSACGGGGDEDSSDTTVGEETKNLLSAFPAQGGFLLPGQEQRITYALADFEGVPIDGPDQLTFRLVPPQSEDEVEVAAERHEEGIPTPYYPVRFTPEVEGTWTALVDVDGQQAEASFAVSPAADVTAVGRGQAFPAIETPTTADARGVDPICTADPICPLHDVTVAEAIAGDGPLAVLVATPAFCQTMICGPVLDVLLQVQDEFPDVKLLHSEVYTNPLSVEDVAQATPAPLTSQLDLAWEPSLYLVGSDGTVVDRLDNIFDVVEVQTALGELS